LDLVDGEFAVIVCWGEGSAASSRGLFAWLRVWATTRRGWLIRSARGTMIDAEAAGAGRLIASFVDEPEVWGDEMADAKVNQELIKALKIGKKTWETEWAATGRAKRIEARYGLGRELQSLLKEHDDTRSHRKAVRQCCYELTKDSTAAYQLLGVAKGVPRELIKEACHKDSCVTWTHLLVIARIKGKKSQLRAVNKCRKNERFSVQQLKDWLKEEVKGIKIADRLEKPRFTVLTKSLGLSLEKTNRLVDAANRRGKDQSTALAEAATRVKDSQSEKAMDELEATSRNLEKLLKKQQKLREALEDARGVIREKKKLEAKRLAAKK